MSQNQPATLGKYQIIREIARSNDIVYEAFDPVMNRRVALKELAVPHGSTDAQREDRLKRFLREARAAGSLVHPNIVTIYEVSREGDRHYIAMEFLDGRTLRADLDSSGFLPIPRAIEIATSVLKGLSYAHSKGVIHRDIKPENIQLLENGQVKITDFGIARLTFEPNITMDGQVFGTPSYMSPEQINGKEIDVRTDLFSVGTILYEMIAGQKPFGGDSVVAITYAIMNKQPDRPNQATNEIWNVLTRVLDKTPGMRYSTADEMVNALEAAKHPSPQPAVDPNWNPVVGQPSYQQPYQQQTMPQAFTTPYGQAPVQTGPPPVLMQPSMTHYQPYSQPQTGYQQPQQTAYQQPYNPYQGQAPAPPQGMPRVPFPAYYPPPPKKPLLSEEAKTVMWKFLGFTAALAVFIGVILYFLQLLSNAPAPNLPTIPGTQSNNASPSSGSKAAALQNASRLMQEAAGDGENERRIALWDEANREWRKAAEAVPGEATSVYSEAARQYWNLAVMLRDQGERVRARQAANHGIGFAMDNPDMKRQLEMLLQELGA